MDAGWVRRTERDSHVCPVPRAGSFGIPDGSNGDLWRCPDCRALWRVADACDLCDAYGRRPHLGQHAVGASWRPATSWQRLRAAVERLIRRQAAKAAEADRRWRELGGGR